MTHQWTIKPLCFGEFPEFEKSVFTYLRNAGEKIRAPILGWLVQSGSDAILVDTGPSTPELADAWHTPIRRTAAHEPAAAVRAAGVAPERLKLVVLTHLHWDHCYNLEAFPAARFLVQAEEVRAAVDPVPSQRLPYELDIPGRRPPWMTAFDRLDVIRGDIEVVPGVTTVMLPGHTPGLQGVLVDTASGRHLIASDALPLAENLGTKDSRPIALAIHTDVATCFRSFERMRAVADVILPSHDMSVLEHDSYPVGGGKTQGDDRRGRESLGPGRFRERLGRHSGDYGAGDPDAHSAARCLLPSLRGKRRKWTWRPRAANES